MYKSSGLKFAQKISKTKRIGILATNSVTKSKSLTQYIKENSLSKDFKFFKLNGSELVELVESGKFMTDKKYSNKVVKKILDKNYYKIL